MKAKIRRLFEVKSEMIHKIGFDATTPGIDRGYLVVQFANNFKAYAYVDVPWSDYLQLMNAPSIGAAFILLIRDKYKGELITPQDTHLVSQTELSVQSDVHPAEPRSTRRSDDVPMLDVMGADSSALVAKFHRYGGKSEAEEEGGRDEVRNHCAEVR